MATLKNVIRDALRNDGTLPGYLTGGIYNAYDDLGRDGLTPNTATYDSNGLMKPTAVLTWGAETPTELLNEPPSERRYFMIWFYDDATHGFATIDLAIRRVKDLLDRKRWLADNQGLNQTTFADTLGEFHETELQDASANRSRYFVDYTLK